MRLISATLALLLVLTVAAEARDLALVVGNRDNRNAGRVQNADAVFSAVFALRSAGFEVISGRDANQDQIDGMIDQFIGGLPEADRIVIVLAGHFAASERDTFFLTVDGNPSTAQRLARTATSLTDLLSLAATKPGGAVLVLGSDPSARLNAGRGLSAGIGDLAIPQGVTVVKGEPRDVARFVTGELIAPGATIAGAVARSGGTVTAEGFVPALYPFLGGDGATPGVDPEAAREEGREDGFWAAVQALETEEAIDAYEEAYPRGRYASEAAALRRELRDAPLRDAEAAEQALSLSRDQRRAVQRALVLLGYNTRGIDGIFGNGTRGALRDWQTANRLLVSGFINADQLELLNRQARARTAELEAEAAERAQQEARREEIYWRRVQRADSVEGYRAYLMTYPEGAHVAEAEARVRQFERQARRAARAEERNAWDNATVANSAESYSEYLRLYPEGAFSGEATARLAALEEEAATEGRRAELQAEEERVVGNPILRLMTERRLAELGLDPGRVDGSFDGDTRRALRRFQRDRGMEVTGFVTQDVAVRMLAEAINP